MIIPKKLLGDSRATLPTLPEKSVHCCITSVPYWGLRSYLPKGHPLKHLEIGCEPTFELYLDHISEVFKAVHRVLRDDGTLWINVGDAYSNDTKWGGKSGGKNYTSAEGGYEGQRVRRGTDCDPKRGPAAHGQPMQQHSSGLKPKDLLMMPARVAMRLQADGWYLRSQIPWLKRNCLSGGAWVYVRSQKGDMPMMVKDLARLRPSTLQLWNGERWTQVVDIHKAERGSTQLEIELRSGERIGCTPEHRWPTTRGLLHASELKIGDIFQKCRVPEPAHPVTPHRLPDDVIGWLCGLYLAEGFISNGRIVLCGHSKETPYRVLALTDLVHSLHGRLWASKQGGNAETLHVSCPALAAVVQDYISGLSAKTKCLTTKCWNRSNLFLRCLLMGYLEGDGHRDAVNEGRWRLGFCNNDALARDLRVMCARLGMGIRIRRAVVTAEKGGKLHKIWRGEIRMFRREENPNPTTFKKTDDCEIVAIRKSRARQFWDIGVADDPHLFALASGVLTHNSMPESVRDRPATAVEYVFLFSKSQKYFYDRFAVMQQSSDNTHPRVGRDGSFTGNGAVDKMRSESASRFPAESERDGNRRRAPAVNPKTDHAERGTKQNASFAAGCSQYVVGTRNRRNSDWFMESWQGLLCDDGGEPLALVVNPKGTTIKHFASYPPKLVEPMIKASTGEKGCCAKCGAQWTRRVDLQRGSNGRQDVGPRHHTGYSLARLDHRGKAPSGLQVTHETTGWQPGCECQGKLVKGKIIIPARISKEAAGENWGADANGEYLGLSTKNHRAHGVQDASDVKARIIRNATEDREVDAIIYVSDLPLDAHPVEPCTVLDPFSGTGCTAMVATNLGRRSVSCELNPEYFKDSDCRDSQCGLSLL